MRILSSLQNIFFLLFICGNSGLTAQILYKGSTGLYSSAKNYLSQSNSASSSYMQHFSAFKTISASGTIPGSNDPDIKIYSGFGENILNSFKGNNLYLHLGAIASTAVLVSSGSDFYVHKYFNEHPGYGDAVRPVVHIANYFPFAVGGSLYAYGKLNGDNKAVGASFAVLQSTVLAFSYNTLLKAITGRPGPRWMDEPNMEELSKTFRFGFLRGGVFWGWPSGHTSSTIAVISALTNFYPEKTWLKIAGYSYAAYMMFAVSSLNRGGMHWFSDAVAAALMSYAIGSTVGKYYRDKFGDDKATVIESMQPEQNLPIMNFTLYF